jgi:hypothetical protein
VAFYFIGHGPRREPRLIELQHMRVLRYRELAHHPDDADFKSPQIFIDLNHERRSPTPQSFPQFYALIAAIREGAIGIVYLDVHEEQSPSISYSWVRMYLEAAGAKVINVFYDEDRVFENAVKQRYGPDVSPEDIDDASDFVCFFPRSAFYIASRSLGRSPLGMTTVAPEELRSHWYRLKDLHPYARGETPFVEARLDRIWKDLSILRRNKEQADRKETELLFRLAPDGNGLLMDEGLYEPRNHERLAWAEKRVCEDLKFTRVEEDRLVSYQRETDGVVIFADIRGEGRINFYVFDNGGRTKGFWTPDFCIHDRVKTNLEPRWLEAVRSWRSSK